MKVAFVSVSAPDDAGYWSGTPHFMRRYLLEQFPNLTDIASFQLISEPFKVKASLYKTVIRRQYVWEMEPLLHEHLAIQLENKLRQHSDLDLIISPGCFPCPTALVSTNVPILLWSDATFAGLQSEHPAYRNLCRETIWSGNALQQTIFDSTRFAVFASEWALSTASANYNVAPSKLAFIPFGANMAPVESTPAEIESLVRSRPTNSCRLTLIAGNWHEKGGDFALQVLNALNESGLETSLSIIGTTPPESELSKKSNKWLTVYPSLSKGDPKDLKQLERILRESHFLLLPTSGECFGISICEANAYAVPALAHNTGGVSSVIKDGQNGRLFDSACEPSAYAAFIMDQFSNREEYVRLCLSTFEGYQSRLNWRQSVKAIQNLVRNL